MSKVRKDYEQTWQGRFAKWMREGSGGLEKNMTEALGEDASLHSREISAETLQQRENQQEQRDQIAKQEEHEQYLRLHQWTQTRGMKWMRYLYRFLALVICLSIVAFLLMTVSALPPFGEADNPYNNEVSERYIRSGVEETGAVNFVTGMILDYRAFDTFGESTVLFTAACAVLMLLRLDQKKGAPSKAMIEAEWDDRHHEPKNDLVLQRAATFMVPIILLFGIYVILNGHLSPGGGFSGGAVMGAGLILYLNAFGFQKTERFFTNKTFQVTTFAALMTYALLKSYSFFTGANHLESGIPLGQPGAILSSGFILPLNICVGLIVMCTMYAFYTLFRKGGM